MVNPSAEIIFYKFLHIVYILYQAEQCKILLRCAHTDGSHRIY